jgi:uncharacterized repeat protein (TIGR01451 family)
VDTVSAGQQLTYSVVITNHGPAAVTSATFTDIFPAGFTLSYFTITNPLGLIGTVNSLTQQTGSITLPVSIPAQWTYIYNFTGTLANYSSGVAVNTVTIAAPSGTTDPNLGNNTASDIDQFVSQS